MPEVGPSPQVKIQTSPAQTPKPSRPNLLAIVIGAAAVVLLIVAIWIGYQALKGGPTPVTTPTTVINQTKEVPEIKSDADLENLEEEVKQTDINGMSTELDKNDADAAEF